VLRLAHIAAKWTPVRRKMDMRRMMAARLGFKARGAR
jgi:hypothetical protein